MNVPPRIMALDLGQTRIGVALSDRAGLTAQPSDTLDVRGQSEDWILNRLVQLVAQHSVGTVVIGHPLEMSGKAGPQALMVQGFVERLRLSLEKACLDRVEIVLWDERLTSVEAERVIAGSRLKNRERRALLDRISAAIVLSSYLELRSAAAKRAE